MEVVFFSCVRKCRSFTSVIFVLLFSVLLSACGGGGSGGDSADTSPPDTTISSSPDSLTNATSATFAFTATETGASFECAIDGGSYAACTSPKNDTGLADGSHTFDVRATDTAGNTDASPATYTWTVDTNAPDTNITSGPASLTNATSATFVFTTTEAGASFECAIDGGSYTACTSSQNYTGLADGSHTFDVRATDTAGNTDASPATYTWTVDTSAPDTNITSGPGSLTNATSATFVFTATEASASFECAIDAGSYTACTSSKSYTGLTNGTHTFDVRATDAAGNTDATPAAYAWTIDTNPPDTTISSGPGTLTNATSATFVFTATETGASFECAIDGGSYTACTSSKSYTGLADGAHTFDVRATDTAGNTDGTPAAYAWTIDTNPPDTNITSGPASLTNVTSATFVFNSADTGASFECAIDGGSYTACTSSQNYTGLADGSHTFDVRATDTAGNTDSSPATYTWTVDTNPPDTTISSGPGSLTNATSATFVFTATETGASFECAIDGGGYAACVSSQNYTGLANGSHTFSVRATDTVGNTDTSPATYNWVVNTSVTGSVSFPFAIETTTTPELSVSAAFDGTNWLVGSYQKDLNGVAGTYVTAQLIDATGSKVGSRIAISSNTVSSGVDIALVPRVAFDGTNYLLVWSDNTNSPNNDIYGQFIDTSGTKVGSSFAISQAAGEQRLSAIVFDGTNYFVVWDDYSRVSLNDRYVYGQLVSTSGTLVGSDIKISTNKARLSSVTFNGTDYLAAWVDDNNTDVMARLVGTGGALGTEFTVNANTTLSDNPVTTVCDTSSGDCLIVWLEEYDVPNKKWDFFYQLVSSAGTLTGPTPNLAGASGNNNFSSVSFDGTNFLIVWTDFTNDANGDWVCDGGEGTCLDVYGQYVDTTGSLSGSSFSININAGNQLGFIAGYGGGNYLLLINDGFTISGASFTSDDVYGQFVTP